MSRKVYIVKYALHPGEVRSRHDGDLHWISPARLAGLYGVKLFECMVWSVERARGLDSERYIHLFPREDGNYQLPTKKGF